MPFGGLLTLGIGMGAKAIGGAIASKGAKKASKQQMAAADKARQFAGERYGEAVNIASPYRQAGEGALRSLSDLMANQRSPMLPSSAAPWMQGQQQQQPMMQNLMPGGMGGRMQSLAGGVVGPGQAGPQRQPGSVMLQSPDGEVRAVPAHLASQFIARGARPFQQKQPMMSEVLQ